jgi:hypothetical protein
VSALERGYVAAPIGIMIAVFKFLCPYPDRMSASSVCSRWRDAASNSCFLLRVFICIYIFMYIYMYT